MCNSETLIEILKFPSFPIHIGGTNQDVSLDIFQDMCWEACHDCGNIQLKHLPDPELVYVEQSTVFAVGPTWKSHHNSFAKFIRNINPISVLEIGGAHGVLSVEYRRMSPGNTPWRIVEPNPSPVADCNATYISKFFEDSSVEFQATDLIVHSHVLEHAVNPRAFLMLAVSKMQPDQLMAVSIPNLRSWLKMGHPNALNFEHTYLLTESIAESLFESTGLEITNKEYFSETHSIFYALRNKGLVPETSSFESDKGPVIFFKSNYEKRANFVRNCNEVLSRKSGLAFLFGGSVFAQQLTNLGLDTQSISCILDNDPNKHGKRLYGTHLSIQNVNIVSGLESPVIIIDCGEYNSEITNQVLSLNKSAEIIVFDPPSFDSRI